MTHLSHIRAKELKEILMPCELVPDLEAQVVNQLGDLIAESNKAVIARVVDITHSLKKEEPKDIYDGEDLFPRKYNEALSALRTQLLKEME